MEIIITVTTSDGKYVISNIHAFKKKLPKQLIEQKHDSL